MCSHVCSLPAWFYRAAAWCGALCAGISTLGSEPVTLQVHRPSPYQVVQRTLAPPDAPEASQSAHALVEVALQVPTGQAPQAWQWRLTTTGDTPKNITPWAGWSPEVANGLLVGTLKLPAGGWFTLELRGLKDNQVIAAAAVSPMGVGEVFLVAGQSYATNCNDAKLRVQDAQERVTAYDFSTGAWRVAHDPQPVVDGTVDGSIWPALGDLLAARLNVPVAFVNVAVGATSSSQWLPEGNLHPNLVLAGQRIGNFRAVLWQQGESDVIGQVSTSDYVANVTRIQQAAYARWQVTPPWLLAKSTLHPTVYNEPVGEGRIRAAIDQLIAQPGFLPGPDTDLLAGVHRGGPMSRRHFSELGQHAAAQLWKQAIINAFFQPAAAR